MQLFDDTAMNVPPSPGAQKDSAGAAAAKAWTATPHADHLPETLNALRRIPESLQAATQEVADRLLKEEFLAIAIQRYSCPERAREPSSSPRAMMHSAKLAVLSAVGHFSFSPWHLADGALLKRVCADLAGATGFDAAARHLEVPQRINLFVAALECDDRESYLKAVRGLVCRHKVNSLVFDAELVEWLPDVAFLSACTEVGIRPAYIGIADRCAAGRHFMLQPEATQARIPALFVDSRGRILDLSDAGEVIRPEDAAQPEASVPEPGCLEPESTGSLAAPPQPAPAVAPTSAIQARIQAIRAGQSRKSARP